MNNESEKSLLKDGAVGQNKRKILPFQKKPSESSFEKMEGRDDLMDDASKILFERIERDSREREQRISKHVADSEERSEKRNTELETRITKMYSDSINKVTESLDNQNKLLEAKLNTMEAKFEKIDTDIKNVDEKVKEIHGRSRFWINLVVPSFIAVVVGILSALISAGFFSN